MSQNACKLKTCHSGGESDNFGDKRTHEGDIRTRTSRTICAKTNMWIASEVLHVCCVPHRNGGTY